VLRFLFTEINYGGRVTDDKDRRLINNLVTTFCGPQVLEEGYRWVGQGGMRQQHMIDAMCTSQMDTQAGYQDLWRIVECCCNP
jgi:hypothetical protein